MFERLTSQARMAGGLLGSVLANQVGRVTLPRVAYFLVTWKCNLRCVMCNVWKEDLYPHLDTASFLQIIRKVPFLDVIKIAGGEPFLRDDMGVLVREIQETVRPRHLMITTNATTRDRLVEFVKERGRPGLTLRISLEGKGGTHDKLRGRRGCFDKTMDTLEALLPYRKQLGFNLGINFNLAPDTLPDLEWIRKLCRDEQIDFIPGFWVYPFLEPGDPSESRALVDDPVAFRALLEEVYEQTHGVNPLEAHLLRKTAFRIFDEALDPQADKSFACRALRNILYLLPNGEVITCGIKHRSVGNLLHEEISDLWFSARAQEGRRDVDACPGCHQYAMKTLSRAYTGETFGLPRPRTASG